MAVSIYLAGMQRSCFARNFLQVAGVLLKTFFHRTNFFPAHPCQREALSTGVIMKIFLWIIAIIFLIGLLVVTGVLKLIF